MSRKLYLFPDTNIFLQCKPLEQVNFKEITDCDEVEVIITRPVQQEIDRQKGQGNTRLSKKAKATASLFVRIIQAEGRFLCLRESAPRVMIRMDIQLKPDDALAQFLNFQEADDRFVGIAYGFDVSEAGDEKAILTGDSGPMISALTHGICCPEVPESWMLLPETDEQAKKIAQLEKELKRHAESRPVFAINTDEHQPTWDGRQFNFASCVYSPLTVEEIKRLISKISAAFPLVTNFQDGMHDETNFGSLSIAVRALIDEVYEPASDKAIANYQEILYPEWLRSCDEIIRNIHNALNPQCFKHSITFLVSNEGYTIAERAEIIFSASGKFGLGDSTWKLEMMRTEPDNVSLPRPPAAPKGKWVNRLGADPLAYARSLAIPAMPLNHPGMPVQLNGHRNKNDFYYLAENRKIPVKNFGFECEEWRHQDKEESFTIIAFFPPETGDKRGSLEVKIHANNLLEPVIKHYPVKFSVYETSAYEYAESLIDDFISAKGFSSKPNIS